MPFAMFGLIIFCERIQLTAQNEHETISVMLNRTHKCHIRKMNEEKENSYIFLFYTLESSRWVLILLPGPDTLTKMPARTRPVPTRWFQLYSVPVLVAIPTRHDPMISILPKPIVCYSCLFSPMGIPYVHSRARPDPIGIRVRLPDFTEPIKSSNNLCHFTFIWEKKIYYVWRRVPSWKCHFHICSAQCLLFLLSFFLLFLSLPISILHSIFLRLSLCFLFSFFPPSPLSYSSFFSAHFLGLKRVVSHRYFEIMCASNPTVFAFDLFINF